MPRVPCPCSTPKAKKVHSGSGVDIVCECGCWLEWHDHNGRCCGTTWSDEGEPPMEGTYRKQVDRLPDFIDVNVPDYA